MALSKTEFSGYIKQFNFRELFNDMGWNNDKTKHPIVVDSETYTLQAVGEKSGFKILLCNTQPNGLLPDYNTRKKIETKVTKLFQEHLIIFFDTQKTEQIWQSVVRQSGKPTKVTETRWHIKQDPELLYQRAAGIFFELDEEDKITIVDVKNRVGENFQQNNEKVTKQFYDKFKKEHSSFLQFIKGINEKTNQEWYASLMLNRLMFCYFIQKKGFLDNNKNYLRDKLKACKEKKGDVKFYSFYRDFLLLLFHKGLNEPAQNQEVKIEIGKIPYLNGGLFDEHELEKNYASIEIDDQAFEGLFDFFDQYEWHLDTRNTATGKDINPDVIGYIFEKYINDRSNMGAYYTKEDITDYISKNCILPYLFDETKRNYAKAFVLDSELWQMVKQSGDTYIYDAVKKGVEQSLPQEIEEGIKDVSKRNDWNHSASVDYALPTEIWREVVDRRSRYTQVKTKINRGEITAINDFITYNLNIRQFAQDAVENTKDPELLKHFYKALNSVTIIDPTCGSGAFLFAAMNILEPLYESCLQRMENFVVEATKGKYKYFEEVLAQVKSPEHPNLQYFIYKSIILRNLYGVDIMKEAVEIAKLRLFLKLVATVEADYRKPNLGLEPLPDIDFNIRAGNTLVGFATEPELDRHLAEDLMGSLLKNGIKERCEVVSKTFKRYKEIQLTYGDDFKEFKKAKEDLNKRLKELNHELNQLLHKQASGLKFDYWLKTHQPFHWFAEFYEILQTNGGFDVIIGNPPYVEYKDIKNKYSVSGFITLPSKDLYAFCTERSINLLKTNGKIGLIIPISIFGTSGFKTLQSFVIKRLDNLWVSSYSNRPSQLFDGAQKRLTIILGNVNRTSNSNIHTSKYFRWTKAEFDFLFPARLEYLHAKKGFVVFDDSLEKLSNILELSAFNKILSFNSNLGIATNIISKYKVYYTRKFSYFLSFLPFIPKITQIESGVQVLPSELKEINCNSEIDSNVVIAVLSSTTFFWFWNVLSDCRNLNKRDLLAFPFNPSMIPNNIKENLSKLGLEYVAGIKETSAEMIKSGLIIETFKYSNLKGIINKIDHELGSLFLFTDEELDFIVNYDIKYRMGKELDNDNEE